MSKNIGFTEMALKYNLFGGISSQIPKTQNLSKKWKVILRTSFIKRQYRNFPSSPVVRTSHLHCRRPRFNPQSQNQDPTGCRVQPKKKKKDSAHITAYQEPKGRTQGSVQDNHFLCLVCIKTTYGAFLACSGD